MQIQPQRLPGKQILVFLAIFIASVFLTMKIHHGKGFFNWQSEIWADKAGYYIFLPATFFYHWDISQFPPEIDSKTGYGFFVDRTNKVMVTQYYYGEALLLSPFFIATHFIAKVFGLDEYYGFSPLYHKAMNVAAIFYLVLGLWFLKKFLANYFKEGIQYLILFVTYIGTNLFYYSLDDTLMSHVYSFFAISLFLFAMKKFLDDTARYRYFLLMIITFGLMVAIRHTNVIVGICFMFWDAGSFRAMVQRLKMILRLKYILPFLAILFLFLLPQMIYWKYSHGSYIYLKYGIGFSNYNHPKLMEVWFATLNGLFPYSPVVLLFVAGMFLMIWKRIPNGIGILFIFLLVSYMAAAYHVWYYGCCFGHRAFVEYYPILCIPFGYLAASLVSMKNRILPVIIGVIACVMIFVNVAMSLSMEKCNFGSTWDTDQYIRQFARSGLFPRSMIPYSFKNDFEDETLTYGEHLAETPHRSGMFSIIFNKDYEFGCTRSAFIYNISRGTPKIVDVSLWVNKVTPFPLGAMIVCSYELNNAVVKWDSEKIDPFVTKEGEWFLVEKKFVVPAGLSGDTQIKVYVWNQMRTEFYVDDLLIRYE